MTAAYRPVARTFDASASDLDASRLVDISDHALDYMSDVTYHDGHHTALTNPSNGYDGDPTTYAEAGTPTAAGDFVYLRVTNYASGGPRAWDGMARVRFVAGTESGERRIVISVDDSSIRWYGIVFSEEMEEDDVYDVVFPLPHPLGPDVPAGNLLSPVLTVNVLDGDRIYLCQMYTPEVDTGGELSEALAQAYLREPEADAAEVHLMGQLGPVTPTLTVTPLDGVAVDVPVERIEYSLTNEEGLVTRYYLGQAFNAELMSQAVVLERLAKRAVKG